MTIPHEPPGAEPFGRVEGWVGACLAAVLIGGLIWAAVAGRPAAAERPRLFGGSLVLEDARPLSVLDVATAQITVRLVGVDADVGAPDYGQVEAVPMSAGSLLLNRVTGSFNYLAADDYVTDTAGPGVGLGPLVGSTGAQALTAGPDAYIVRSGPAGAVYLVGPQTVAAAAEAGSRVEPIGNSPAGGPVVAQPGYAAVSGPDLWVLAGHGSGCQAVRFHPDPSTPQGLRATPQRPVPAPCTRTALEAAGPEVVTASPGRVQLTPDTPSARNGPQTVTTAFDAGESRIVPVTGATGDAWFLADDHGVWRLFGVDGTGTLLGPYLLTALGPDSDPAPPVEAGGFLYTLDRHASGPPVLWTIAVSTGRMAPLPGVGSYPLRSATEKDAFAQAEVLQTGPRVVYNNPESLDAVVVFTDGSRPPVVVDKSQAVAVSAAGPDELGSVTGPAPPKKTGRASAPPAASPVVQAVTTQITCATTSQKPYAPQITDVRPASESAFIRWSYQLLDQTDCEPASWTVTVRALSGSHQPAAPVRTVSGQDGYMFVGLRPSTTYQAVVTAFINRQSTPSAPVIFTTAARGPDPPVSVRTTADGKGDWVVSWTGCTEATNANCVVPADEWTVVGSACGRDFVGAPPTVEVSGSQDQATIDAAQLRLLGDSLSFTVQGALASGLTGNPTSDGSCTEAWARPDPSAIALTGAGTAAPDGTITAILQVATIGDPAAAFGAQPAQTEFVYGIDGRTIGPTSATKVTVPGLPAGATFVPQATVYPTGHPDGAVTVQGPPFSQTLTWPTDLPTGTTAVGTVNASDPNSGSFTVTFPADLPSGPLQVTGAMLQCGGPGGETVAYDAQTVKAGRTTFGIEDLVDQGGSCVFRFTLTDTARPDPFGTPSPEIEADFTIGHDPGYSFAEGFSAECQRDAVCNPPFGVPWSLTVSTEEKSLAAGGDWTVTAEIKDQRTGKEVPADPCRAMVDLPSPDFPSTISLPSTCTWPTVKGVDVLVSYKYIGQRFTVDAGRPDNAPGQPALTPPPTTTIPPPSTTTLPPPTT